MEHGDLLEDVAYSAQEGGLHFHTPNYKILTNL